MTATSPPPSARHTLDGTLRVFLAEALLFPTGLLTAAFLSRRLGPEGYGAFTLASVLVSWVEWTLASLFSRSAIKFISEAADWRPVAAALVQLYLLLGLAAGGMLWLAAPAAAALLRAPELAGLLRLFALDIPLMCLTHAHRQILVGQGRFTERAVASAGRWLARLLLIVLLVQAGWAVPGAIVGSLGATLVELLLSRWYVRPPLRTREHFPLRPLLTYSVPLLLSALSLRVLENLDLFAVKVLGGTVAQAGQYGAAENLALVLGVLALAFAPLLQATLGRYLAAGQQAAAQRLGHEALRAVAGLMPFMALAAGGSREIIDLIYGPAFAPAGPWLALLVWAGWALLIIAVVASILTAAGRPALTLALTAGLPPLALAGHLLLIPRFGPLGAALVTTIVAGLCALASLVVVQRVWQIQISGATLVRTLILAGLAWSAAALWPAPGLWVVLKLAVLSFALAGLLWVSGEITPREIALLRSLLPFAARRTDDSPPPLV
jgi:O-antigen/teichoic acid export membrane protein